jgi:arylsulfatase A-like enzyme
MPVILVTVDAASADHLDLYGYERKTMPRLTRRAASGVVFERAFSFGPSTRLTFPSMMTGRFMTQIRHKAKPRAHGPWDKGNVTLADLLAKAGYATHAVAADPYFSRTTRWIYQGFDSIDDAPAKSKRGVSASLVTDAALAALDGLAAKDRFFLWLHYMDAHMASGDYKLPSGVKPFPGGKGADKYDTKLLLIDEQLDRLLAGIDARLADRPRAVIVTADHGESYDRKHAAKAHHGWDLTTSVTNVPLVVWSPWTKVARSRRLTSSLDLAPTILNMLGLRARGLEGDSLLPSLQGAKDPGRPILQQMFIPEFLSQGKAALTRVALRHGDYVLQRTAQVNELYDYASDRGEERNLFQARPDEAETMMEVTDALLRKD